MCWCVHLCVHARLHTQHPSAHAHFPTQSARRAVCAPFGAGNCQDSQPPRQAQPTLPPPPAGKPASPLALQAGLGGQARRVLRNKLRISCATQQCLLDSRPACCCMSLASQPLMAVAPASHSHLCPLPPALPTGLLAGRLGVAAGLPRPQGRGRHAVWPPPPAPKRGRHAEGVRAVGAHCGGGRGAGRSGGRGTAAC